MKQLVALALLSLSLSCHALDYKESIGQRYFEFLSNVNQDTAQQLFTSEVKKIVNSTLICDGRDQLIAQMQQVQETFGIQKIELLELIRDEVNIINCIRFEVTWSDNITESIIAIIRGDGTGLITEINEVFGEKAAYEWSSH